MDMTKENLYELYIKQNKSQREIAEIFGCKEGKIDYWTRKYGIAIKKSDPDSVFNLKNISRFDPIFCYYAGLVATDGYFDTKNNRVSLRVKNEGSYEVLNKINSYFDHIKPIQVYTSRGRSESNDLTLVGSVVPNELKRMGIFGYKYNRTFSLDWYNEAEDCCKQMFLRGILDGDGNIRKNGVFRLSMVSFEFVENLIYAVNNILGTAYEMKYSSNSSKRKYPSIELHVADSIRFCDFIYKGFCEYRFSDKYEKYYKNKEKRQIR